MFRYAASRDWKRACRDGANGVATRNGLDDPRIESRRGRDFPHPSRTALGPTEGYPSFPGVKRPGRGVDHSLASCAEGKERVELYLCSHSGPSWPVLGRTVPLPFGILIAQDVCLVYFLTEKQWGFLKNKIVGVCIRLAPNRLSSFYEHLPEKLKVIQTNWPIQLLRTNAATINLSLTNLRQLYYVLEIKRWNGVLCVGPVRPETGRADVV
jgi:hypothetical protein